jgi:atlastin
MDTQGSFDNQSTLKEVTNVFALSTLTSSLQIYNIKGNLGQDNLEHLSFFVQHGKLAIKDRNYSKPFQVHV